MKQRLILLFLLYPLILNAQQFEWLQTIRPGGNEYCWGLDTDPAGNIVATGRVKSNSTFGTGAFQQSPPAIGLTETDVFLAKYDPFGNLKWVKRHGGYEADWGRSVASDNQFNSVVVGDYCDTAWFGPYQIVGLGNNINRNIFIACYDSVGNVKWAKTAGHASNDSRAYAVDTDELGNVYVGGHISGPSNFDGKPFGVTGKNLPFIAKFGPTGQCIWVQHLTCQYSGEVNGLTYANGKIYITGGYRGTLTVGGTPYAGNSASWSDVFLIKLDTSGTSNWVRTALGGFQDQGNAVTVDNQNNVYITGTFANDLIFPSVTLISGTFSGSAAVANAGINGFIARYDVNGNYYWAKKVYSQTAVGLTGIGASTSGKVYITGQIKDTFQIDGQTFNYANSNNSALTFALDISGGLLWTKLAGGGVNDHAASNAITVDKWNNLFIGGNYQGSTCMFDNIAIPSQNGWDGFIAKLFPALGPVIQVSDTAVCGSDSVVYQVSQDGWPFNLSWSIPGATPAASSLDSFTATYPGPGNYSGSLSISGTVSSGIFPVPAVHVYPSPLIDLGSDTTLCMGNSLQLTSDSSYSSYTWSTGETVNQIVVSTTGSYALLAANGSGCTATDTILVQFTSVNAVVLGNDTVICSGTSVLLDAGSGFSSYSWSDGTQLQFLQVSDSGLYSVTVTDTNGCTSTDDILIDVDSCSSVSDLEASNGQLYPNPARGQVFVSGVQPGMLMDIMIFDNSGKIVLHTFVTPGSSLDLNNVATGIYFVQVRQGSTVFRCKLMIQ